VEVETAMLLTGTGKEVCRIEDEGTQRLYRDAEKFVDREVALVTELAKNGERIKIIVPRILTLTSIQKLYRLWDEVLDRDPRYYPFADIIRRGIKVGQVGGGDTTKTMTELFARLGPSESYPDGSDPNDIPEQILYNVPAKTVRGYRLKSRTRYWALAEKQVKFNPNKVKYLRNANLLTDGGILVVDEKNGFELLDYVMLSTGFERDPVEDKLSDAGFEIQPLIDREGQPIGLGSYRDGILINGPATGFTKEDLPDKIQQIIDTLGIRENTVALWVYQVLITRMLWTYFSIRGVDQKKVQDLLINALYHDEDPILRWLG